MEEHDEINWSAVLREHLEEELDAVEPAPSHKDGRIRPAFQPDTPGVE